METKDWPIIIAAIFVGIGGLLTPLIAFGVLVLAFLERQRAAERAHEIAVKVEAVKITLANVSTKQEQTSTEHGIVLNEIKTHVNGLVKKVEDAAFIAGAKSEQDKGKT